MKAQKEQRRYLNGTKVWAGRYKNIHNMPHWHYDCELIYVEKGCMEIFCNQTMYKLEAGQAFYVDSGQMHYMHALSEDTVHSIIIFDYDLIKPAVGGTALVSPLLSADYGAHKLYLRLMKEFKAREQFYENATSLLVALTLLNIFRNEETSPKEKNVRTVERLKLLLNEIDEKYEFYDLDSAANFIGMNSAYFSRLFHKLTGMTFSHYLNYVRTENAVNLLKTESDVPITEISTRCGFATIRNFNRIFKEFTGYTPKNMPKDYIMKSNFTNLNETSADPTSAQSEMLESSDN